MSEAELVETPLDRVTTPVPATTRAHLQATQALTPVREGLLVQLGLEIQGSQEIPVALAVQAVQVALAVQVAPADRAAEVPCRLHLLTNR